MQKLSAATVVDEEVLDAMVKELGNALMESDVNIKLVIQLRKNIRWGLARSPRFPSLSLALSLSLPVATIRLPPFSLCRSRSLKLSRIRPQTHTRAGQSGHRL
jgi:hypothetical protein